jgi:hypothetical protein
MMSVNVQRERLRALYLSHGVKFSEGNIVLDFGAKGTLSINEDVLLEPSEKSVQTLKDTLEREMKIEFEIFDTKDKQFEVRDTLNYHRVFGRAYHHEEWVCCPPRRRVYYNYLTMSAPASVSPDAWEKMGLYLACLVTSLGILVVLGIISGGTSVAASALLFSAVAGACLAALAAVTSGDQEAASINTHVGR